MAFHLGKPILAMTIIAAITGAAAINFKEPPARDLTLWVFADSHFQAYRKELPTFEQADHQSVDMQIVQVEAMNRRLQAAFADKLEGPGVPDLVEIEIGQIGKFFRPPVGEVGFEPLGPMLKQSGLYDQIVESRFAPWTKQGVIFGVPHDVHPCGIAYREDLFREAGIDLSTAATWPQFQQACLAFQTYWKSHGYETRHAMELYAAKVDYLLVMLQQRGINIVDDFNRISLSDPKVAETIAFYAQCVAGPERIGGESAGGVGPLTRDINDGNLCAFISPDWRLPDLKKWAPNLAGKMRLMPLPRFDPTDAPTATYGGTMIAILRSSKHKAEAWKLIEHLYFSPESLETRRQMTQILPPIKSAWTNPEYHKPDPYFGGQYVDELLIDLAAKIPRRYVTPATTIANFYLTEVLSRAAQQVRHGHPEGLKESCQAWLDQAAVDLADRMKQWEFADNVK